MRLRRNAISLRSNAFSERSIPTSSSRRLAASGGAAEGPIRQRRLARSRALSTGRDLLRRLPAVRECRSLPAVTARACVSRLRLAAHHPHAQGARRARRPTLPSRCAVETRGERVTGHWHQISAGVLGGTRPGSGGTGETRPPRRRLPRRGPRRPQGKLCPVEHPLGHGAPARGAGSHVGALAPLGGASRPAAQVRPAPHGRTSAARSSEGSDWIVTSTAYSRTPPRRWA